MHFAHGPKVKDLPCDAGNMGSISGSWTEISHGLGQLSPSAIATESVLSGAWMLQLRPDTAK